MEIAKESLEIKRKTIEEQPRRGMYPYSAHYLENVKERTGSYWFNHFNTIGLIGMNEACLNFMGKDITTPEGQKFSLDILDFMRDTITRFQEETGHVYNLEATPAEGTSYSLARLDKKKYPDIITAAKNPGDTPYYTNSSHLPVGYTADIFDALAIQDELQTLYTSGTVFHAFLGEKLPDWKAAANLVRKIAENYKLPYYTMSPTYSVCADHGYLTGEQFTCPICGKPAEVYSRITGYYRPVQNWNDGKSQEYRERREYDVEHHSTWPGAKEKEEEKAAPCCGTLKLFTTRTCPNCAMAKEQLNSIGLVYEVIDAEEHPELAMQYGLRQAPTLIVEKDGEVQKFAGIANVLKFVDANRKAV